MQRFEWAEKGLLSKLSENLVPFHPTIKTSDELAGAASANAAATAAAAATVPSSASTSLSKQTARTAEMASLVTEDHSNPGTWARVHSLSSELTGKVGRVFSYLSVHVNTTLLTFSDQGAVVLKGREIPGTDIVAILVSAVGAANKFEIGEMLVLSLLQHSPSSVVRLIQTSKVSFIRDEHRKPPFSPQLQGKRRRNNGRLVEAEEDVAEEDKDEIGGGGKKKAKIIAAKVNPQMTATYVPKTPRRNGLSALISSQTPHSAMASNKQWFDLS
jgi:hypothetical protein